MSTDTQLRNDIEAEFDYDPRFDSRQIGVAVKNGIVSLTGYVGSYAERRAAEEAAQSVAGVKALANDIAIELPSSLKRTDAEIAEIAVAALKSNVSVPANDIRLIVHEGWLTLEGQVRMWYQKNAAEFAVAGLHGVKGIRNNITIRSQASVANVQTQIENAFRRRAQLDAKNIRVKTTDGTVTLDGEVPTWQERQQAENAAWLAAGVSKVVDNLSVRP